jgi:hypothetical protein
MSIDVYIELDETISQEQLRSALTATGARLTSEASDGFTGEYPDSGMTFFHDVLPAARHLRAEVDRASDLSIGSQLSLRPRVATFETAKQELRRLVELLAQSSGGSFVMSDQYDTVLAIRDPGGLKVTGYLSAGMNGDERYS